VEIQGNDKVELSGAGGICTPVRAGFIMRVYARSQVFCIRHTRQASQVAFPEVNTLWVPSVPVAFCCTGTCAGAGLATGGYSVTETSARLGSNANAGALTQREVYLDDLLVILGS